MSSFKNIWWNVLDCILDPYLAEDKFETILVMPLKFIHFRNNSCVMTTYNECSTNSSDHISCHYEDTF